MKLLLYSAAIIVEYLYVCLSIFNNLFILLQCIRYNLEFSCAETINFLMWTFTYLESVSLWHFLFSVLLRWLSLDCNVCNYRGQRLLRKTQTNVFAPSQ